MERVTLLKHSSAERVLQLRHSSTERVPIIKHSSTEKVPLLKRSSPETFQLTRMSPFRHFFTKMCYYNRCSDFLWKSVPHATINWCHWLDLKKRYSSYTFWVEIISQGTTFGRTQPSTILTNFLPRQLIKFFFSPLFHTKFITRRSDETWCYQRCYHREEEWWSLKSDAWQFA